MHVMLQENQPHPFCKVFIFIEIFFFSPRKRQQQGDCSLPKSLHATGLNPHTHNPVMSVCNWTCPVNKCLVLWESQRHRGEAVSYLKPILTSIFMAGHFTLLLWRNSRKKPIWYPLSVPRNIWECFPFRKNTYILLFFLTKDEANQVRILDP